MIRNSFAWGGLLLGGLALGLANFAGNAAPQNILLIIADDVGADASRLYNSTSTGAVLPPTPNIAALASSGVVFGNAYANPLCSPTRACLLTGRHSFRTGVGSAFGGAGSTPLAASEFTLPEAFAAAATGHHLAQFGKWHLASGANAPLTTGGWTNFAGSIQGAITSYTNWTKVVNGAVTMNYTNYATSDVVDDAVAWINARGTNTWFTWVAFNAGHTPLHKPPAHLAPSYAGLPGTTTHINNNPELYFHAMIEAMDTEIGRLLAAVTLTNTHVIFLGDNGSSGQSIQPPYSSQGAKRTVYEGGVKVPFIIAGPAVVNPGRTNNTLVHAVDLFATILELAGTNTSVVPAGVTVDSRSLLPQLQSEALDANRRVYTEVFDANAGTMSDARSLRDARYKLIRFNSGGDEFYDLQTDPSEATNLLNALTIEQRQYYNRLQFQLYGYSTNTGALVTGATWTTKQFSCVVTPPASFALWRCADVATGFWSPVTNALATTNAASVMLVDPAPPAGPAFYSVVK